jgi:hypothetical protein
VRTEPMAATLTATLDIDDRQLRVEHTDARRALEVVAGQDLITARARLRYGPGRTCEALARVLDTAIVRAEHAGLDPARLLIAGGAVEPDEDIVRVRRKAKPTGSTARHHTSGSPCSPPDCTRPSRRQRPASVPGTPASRSRPADAPSTGTTAVRLPSPKRCSRSSTPTSASTSPTSASSGRSGPRTARQSSP